MSYTMISKLRMSCFFIVAAAFLACIEFCNGATTIRTAVTTNTTQRANHWPPRMTDLVIPMGYRLVEHWVVTPDGFVLSLFNIPSVPSGKGPVLLMHGLLVRARITCDSRCIPYRICVSSWTCSHVVFQREQVSLPCITWLFPCVY